MVDASVVGGIGEHQVKEEVGSELQPSKRCEDVLVDGAVAFEEEQVEEGDEEGGEDEGEISNIYSATLRLLNTAGSPLNNV
jgi:hypothetical protein